MNFNEELELVKSIINEEIERLRREEGLIPEELRNAAFHLISRGGKRLRPFIAIHSALLFSGTVKAVLPVAVAIELLHNFTLIHDDIMDQDELRRGVKTTHIIWGVPLAIAAGDVLFAVLFRYLSRELRRRGLADGVSTRVVEEVADGAVAVCEGQAMDLLAEKYVRTEEDYYIMVSKKTGALFEKAAALGGLVGGGSQQEIANLRSYGKNLGIAFQITDDILGIVGDPKTTGKPRGSDIREGKRTVIVLHALRSLSSSDRRYLMDKLGNRNLTKEEISEIISLLERAGSVDYARRKAKEYAEKALIFLDSLPENRHKVLLREVALFVYSRNL